MTEPKKYARGRKETPASKKVKEDKKAEGVKPKGPATRKIRPEVVRQMAETPPAVNHLDDPLSVGTTAATPPSESPPPAEDAPWLKTKKRERQFHPMKARMPDGTLLTLRYNGTTRKWTGALEAAGVVVVKSHSSMTTLIYGMFDEFNKASKPAVDGPVPPA